MNFSATDFVNETELNDFKVYSIELDINNSQFKVLLEGAYVFKENFSKPIIMENGGYIIVKSYESLEARYFLPKDRLWCNLDYKALEKFDEINEKSYENGILILAGNGEKSGYWLEYIIKGGEIEIYLKD